jgi:hypothetical protein
MISIMYLSRDKIIKRLIKNQKKLYTNLKKLQNQNWYRVCYKWHQQLSFNQLQSTLNLSQKLLHHNIEVILDTIMSLTLQIRHVLAKHILIVYRTRTCFVIFFSYHTFCYLLFSLFLNLMKVIFFILSF